MTDVSMNFKRQFAVSLCLEDTAKMEMSHSVSIHEEESPPF